MIFISSGPWFNCFYPSFGLTCCEGPMNLGLPYLRTSIFYYSIFLKIGSLVFLYFAGSWGTISTQNWISRIFLRKFLLAQKRAKGPKWPNLPICALLRHFSQDWLIIFFYILYEVDGPKVLKTDRAEFFGEILACPKVGQESPK